MDKLDDYTYNFLSDYLTDHEDLRREVRLRRYNLIEEGRAQYAEALYADKLAKLDSEVESIRRALNLISMAIDTHASLPYPADAVSIPGSPDRFKEL